MLSGEMFSILISVTDPGFLWLTVKSMKTVLYCQRKVLSSHLVFRVTYSPLFSLPRAFILEVSVKEICVFQCKDLKHLIWSRRILGLDYVIMELGFNSVVNCLSTYLKPTHKEKLNDNMYALVCTTLKEGGMSENSRGSRTKDFQGLFSI